MEINNLPPQEGLATPPSINPVIAPKPKPKIGVIVSSIIGAAVIIGGGYVAYQLTREKPKEASCSVPLGQQYCSADKYYKIDLAQEIEVLADCLNCSTTNPAGCFSCGKVVNTENDQVVFNCAEKNNKNVLVEPGIYKIEASTNCGSNKISIKCENCEETTVSASLPVKQKVTEPTEEGGTENASESQKTTGANLAVSDVIKILAKSCSIRDISFSSKPSGDLLYAVDFYAIISQGGKIDKLAAYTTVNAGGANVSGGMVVKGDKAYGILDMNGAKTALLSYDVPSGTSAATYPSFPQITKVLGEEKINSMDTVIVEVNDNGKNYKVWIWKDWGIGIKGGEQVVELINIAVNKGIQDNVFAFQDMPPQLKSIADMIINQASSGAALSTDNYQSVGGSYLFNLTPNPTLYLRKDICK